MTFLAKLVREPLLHFLVLGAVVFAGYAALNTSAPDQPDAKKIEITEAHLAQTVAQFRSTWRRAPSREELDGLLDTLVREEILVREALALSMDRGDAVIRRRLAQKMAFLMESAAGAQAIDEAKLVTFFEENAEKYASAPMIAFEQIFLGEAPDEAELEKIRVALAQGAAPETLGVPTILPAVVDLASPRAIDGRFGSGFFTALAASDADEWEMPVQSGYGYHAVRITNRRDGTVPAFGDIREQVTEDYRAEMAAEMAEALYAELRAAYRVTLPADTAMAEVVK